MSAKHARPASHCNKSSYVTSVQGRFTPDFRVDCMRSKSFDKHQDQSTSRRALKTPNFSNRDSALNPEFIDQQTTFGNDRKLLIPKLPLDTLLEEDSVSLNLSTIYMEPSENLKAKVEGNDLLTLLDCPEEWENASAQRNKKKYSCLDESSVVDSRCKVLVNNKNISNIPPVNEMLKKQAQKYDKALLLLQAHFQNYKEHAEKQILNLTQELAEAKATLKSQLNERDSIVSSFKYKLKDAKRELEGYFQHQLGLLEKNLNEKEQKKRRSTDERIQQLRIDFEKKASDSAREERTKISSKGYVVLAEENKRLRDDLTNLWKDTDLLAQKLGSSRRK